MSTEPPLSSDLKSARLKSDGRETSSAKGALSNALPASLYEALPLGLQDIEQLRLVLQGHSALDWQRLALQSREEAEQLLCLAGIDVSHPADRAHLKAMYDQALTYLDTYVRQFVCDEVRFLADPVELLMLASAPGPSRADACMMLKVMHVSHHAAGRELLYQLPAPTQELFHRVERRVFEAIDGMKAHEIRVVQFEGSRKTTPSILTKLLCRSDSLAAEVHDRIRFRIITEDLSHLFEALVYLTRTLFPFNYVLPGESRNDLLDLEATLSSDPYLSHLSSQLQPLPKEDNASNPYSAKGFKMINFVVDMPVRVDDLIEHIPHHSDRLGGVVFLLVEFQLVDRDTHHNNSVGDNRHALYKERQVRKVVERLTAHADEAL
jgi:uncharacterized protein (TIGR04552 family)